MSFAHATIRSCALTARRRFSQHLSCPLHSNTFKAAAASVKRGSEKGWRRYATASTSSVPKQRSVLVAAPKQEYLEEEDIEGVDEEEAGVVLTDRAAEVWLLILARNVD